MKHACLAHWCVTVTGSEQLLIRANDMGVPQGQKRNLLMRQVEESAWTAMARDSGRHYCVGRTEV